jgi:hypothetical protein
MMSSKLMDINKKKVEYTMKKMMENPNKLHLHPHKNYKTNIMDRMNKIMTISNISNNSNCHLWRL